MLVNINDGLEVNTEDVSYILLSIDGMSTEMGLKCGKTLVIQMSVAEVRALLFPPKPMTPKEIAIHLAKRKNK